MLCRTLCWPPNCHWLVTVLPQGNVKLHFELFTAFLIGGGVAKMWKKVRAASAGRSVISAGSARQHGSLVMSSGNWGHLSWTCLSSLHRDIARHHLGVHPTQHHHCKWLLWVQHLSPQWRIHTPCCQSLHHFCGALMLTNMIEATWKHVKVHLRPYWENKVKCVINRFKSSLSAEFDDVLEWRKALCLVYYYSVGSYIPFIFSNLIFSWYPKNKYNKSMMKKHAVFYGGGICCAQNIQNL
jgi:hypothetical protein